MWKRERKSAQGIVRLRVEVNVAVGDWRVKGLEMVGVAKLLGRAA